MFSTTMPIPTKAVKAVIKNNKDEILFVKGSPKQHKKLLWDLPGGLIDPGETEKEALRREIEEELGQKIKIIKPLGKWKFFRPLDKRLVTVQNYLGQIVDDNIVLSDEHSAYKWIAINEIPFLKIKDVSLLSALE